MTEPEPGQSLRESAPDETRVSAARVAAEFFPEVPVEEGIRDAALVEASALRAIEAALPKSREKMRQSLDEWVTRTLSHQGGGGRLSVMEHTALLYLEREGL